LQWWRPLFHPCRRRLLVLRLRYIGLSHASPRVMRIFSVGLAVEDFLIAAVELLVLIEGVGIDDHLRIGIILRIGLRGRMSRTFFTSIGRLAMLTS
jgi:hypothetical protein